MALSDAKSVAMRPNPAHTAVLFGIKLPMWNLYLTVIGIAAALVLPFVVEGFTVFQLTQALVYAIAVLGLNLLTGFNGQFSLGHSAFYALGAYTAAIMVERYEVAFYWTILPAGIICKIVQ